MQQNIHRPMPTATQDAWVIFPIPILSQTLQPAQNYKLTGDLLYIKGDSDSHSIY
jgi:hypothetical protein